MQFFVITVRFLILLRVKNMFKKLLTCCLILRAKINEQNLTPIFT